LLSSVAVVELSLKTSFSLYFILMGQLTAFRRFDSLPPGLLTIARALWYPLQ